MPAAGFLFGRCCCSGVCSSCVGAGTGIASVDVDEVDVFCLAFLGGIAKNRNSNPYRPIL